MNKQSLRFLMTGHPRAALHQWRMMTRLASPRQPLRLHLGCGDQRLAGVMNIDFRPTTATDVVCDIFNLPCPDGSVERIESYHVIEHLPFPMVPNVLNRWHRLLKPEGVVVIECPDFDADVRDFLAGNTDRMYSIFGRQRFAGDAHHWGYTRESLCALLRSAGFVHAEAVPAMDYHTKTEPCIRIEAKKG